MGLLAKLITVLRGGAREVGEAIVDANGIRIFEQEIKDAEGHLENAKRDLTAVLAKEMQAAREIERLQEEITKYEGFAMQALDKQNESLALEISEKIAEVTNQLDVQKKAKVSFAEHANRLKELIKKTEGSLADMNRQLTMVKTTASVQKATAAITNNYVSSSSKLLTAKESLERIQKRQQELDDRLKAGEALEAEFSGQNLEEKLRAAGIGETKNAASDILAQLKAKKSGSGEHQ